MGDDSAVLRKMRIGQLHGGVFLAGSFTHVVPDLEIYHLPMLFTSYAEVDAVRAKFDQTLIAALGAAGYHTFGFIEGGFAYMYSTKKVAVIADLKGRKAWIPEGDKIGKVLVDETAMSPVPLSLADVLTGLQTGLVDVVSGPPVAAVALQWFTKVKYVIALPVIYTYGCVALSNGVWSAMSADDRKVVDEVFGRMTRSLDKKAREDNLSARKALEKQGVISITPDADTARQWEAIARRSSTRLVPELGLSRELLAEIEADLSGLRASATAGVAAGP
jgi:TRAP-type C4-dicarboxylate transport system substrate-binding protein